MLSLLVLFCVINNLEESRLPSRATQCSTKWFSLLNFENIASSDEVPLNAAAASTTSNYQKKTNHWKRELNTEPDECFCGKAASLREVTKASPNKNRRFLTCGTGNCTFFKWAE
mmetsp:Transcript_29231/g.40385  ORF Transcript_29231/g.40385 Transcript_29231/m.40385 type:complete len:114 (+) Transcript_29231:54-395(+)